MAESEGFEPPDPFGSTVFKTAAFGRSASSPVNLYNTYQTLAYYNDLPERVIIKSR